MNPSALNPVGLRHDKYTSFGVTIPHESNQSGRFGHTTSGCCSISMRQWFPVLSNQGSLLLQRARWFYLGLNLLIFPLCIQNSAIRQLQMSSPTTILMEFANFFQSTHKVQNNCALRVTAAAASEINPSPRKMCWQGLVLKKFALYVHLL